MITEAKTPGAGGAAHGGDRGVLVGTERPDHKAPLGAVTQPNFWTQDAWLRQISSDSSQGNAAFRGAWAMSTLLRQRGDHAKTTLQAIGAIAGLRGKNCESAMWIRRGLRSLERGGHLWVDRSAGHGRGHFHRYALILKGPLV